MALWDKLKSELDRAGRVAQTAIDDGKVRLDLMRVRQLADKTAEALGYAVFHARQKGEALDADSLDRLSSTLAAHEAELTRLEGQLEKAAASGAETASAAEGETVATNPTEPSSAGATATAANDTATATTAGARPITSVDPAMGDRPDRAPHAGA